jgi:hypothetical protein
MWSWSWYFSQVVAVLLLFLAIAEFLGAKRYWLIGTIFAALLLTRVTAFFGVLFVVADLLISDDRSAHKRVACLGQLALPVVIALALLLTYNFVRFGDPIEQGYGLQTLHAATTKARSYGLFSPLHVPGNLYYLFLGAPEPVLRDGVSQVLAPPFLRANPWGMSLFVTSPWLLTMFWLRSRDRFSLILWASVTAIAVPIVFYYGIGFRQFGYRYSLDFLPIVFWLFMRSYRSQTGALSSGLKSVILISACVNLWLFWGLYLWRR